MLFSDSIRDRNTLMLCVGGSHAYGMATDTSDVDIRGVFHVPRRFRDNPFVDVGSWNPAPRVDAWGPVSIEALQALTPFELRCLEAKGEFDVQAHPLTEFIRYASQSNPTILEYLNAPRYLHLSSTFETLVENRHLFLSRKYSFNAYTGYARGQMERIQTHREWLLNPPKKAPTRADFGLPEVPQISDAARDHIQQATTAIMKDWSTDQGFDGILEGVARQMVERRLQRYQEDLRAEFPTLLTLEDLAAKRAGLSDEVRAVLNGEKRYKVAKKHWSQYQKWKRGRNETRAALEHQFGYDTKFGAHALRLMRTGLEVVREGVVRVHRPDAEELLAVRQGSRTYEDLMEEIEGLYSQAKASLAESPLPAEPDYDAITELLLGEMEVLDAVAA